MAVRVFTKQKKFELEQNSKHLYDYNQNVSRIMVSVLGRVENIVGKGENAGYQHFLLFSTMFSKVFFTRVVDKVSCTRTIILGCIFLQFFPVAHFQSQIVSTP